MYHYLGIDPGKSGGAAIIGHKDRSSAAEVADVFSFKDKTDQEIVDFFNLWKNAIEASRFELVASSPQMGVKSAFTFGDINGFLRGAITAIQIPVEFISPNCWQTVLKCRSGGDKKITRTKAQQLYAKQFPFTGFNGRHFKSITDQIADALLIATYCSRKERGL